MLARMPRVNDILLGPLERPALAWLCRRMPRWVTPDGLTAVGIGGGVLTCLGYGLTRVDRNFLWLACAGLAINWFGDSLDGSLARFRQTERPKYGFFVDHMADAFVTSLVCIGIGLSAYVSMVYALGALVGYLLISILTYVTTHATGVFRLSYGKVGPTEIRAIIIAASAVCYFSPNPVVTLGTVQMRAFELVTLVIAILIGCYCVAASWQTAAALAAQDPSHHR
jgi:phosphatidylglycerophosphate synthase